MPLRTEQTESNPYQSPTGSGRKKHLMLLRAAGAIEPNAHVVTPKGVVMNLTGETVGQSATPALKSEVLSE